jgi:hypothetical protein
MLSWGTDASVIGIPSAACGARYTLAAFYLLSGICVSLCCYLVYSFFAATCQHVGLSSSEPLGTSVLVSFLAPVFQLLHPRI